MVNGINMSSEKQLLKVGIMKWNYGLLRREKGGVKVKGKLASNPSVLELLLWIHKRLPAPAFKVDLIIHLMWKHSRVEP